MFAKPSSENSAEPQKKDGKRRFSPNWGRLLSVYKRRHVPRFTARRGTIAGLSEKSTFHLNASSCLEQYVSEASSS